jgi:small redox-active disulfide protein 2
LLLTRETEMKNVKVLGSGCANCANTLKLIDEVARAKGAEIRLEKVDDLKQIMMLGVLSTPGVVIDGKVVHSGSVPARAKVESWF